MKRRDFLKVSGTIVLASQLPNIKETKGSSLISSFSEEKYTDYVQLPVVRRHVAFCIPNIPNQYFPIPKAGEIVGSPDWSKWFSVRKDVPVIGITPFALKDNMNNLFVAGKDPFLLFKHSQDIIEMYAASIVEVEAITPDNSYVDCPITRKISPPEDPFDFVVGMHKWMVDFCEKGIIVGRTS